MITFPAIDFLSNTQLADCDDRRIYFVDRPLDEFDLKAFRDSSFRLITILIDINENPVYANLSICADKHVEIELGRWETTTDAIAFLNPWLDHLDLYKPAFLMAQWYSIHDATHLKSFVLTRSKNGKQQYSYSVESLRRGAFRLEQPNATFRNRKSYAY